MARVVRSDRYPQGRFDLPQMPAVCPGLLTRYQSILGARLEAFSGHEEECINIPEESRMVDKFRHRFCYDAESVFWWCVRAKPAKELPEEPISYSLWLSFTSEDDG